MSRKLLIIPAVFLCCAAAAGGFNEKKIVTNLAVISDTHVNGYNTVPAYKFRSALIQERDMAARYGGLDGVVVVGDLVDSPAWNYRKYSEINDWKRLYESVFDPERMPMVYTIGNHDVWREWTADTYREAKQFNRRLGDRYYTHEVGDPEMAEKFECRHNVVGGYHILALTPNGRGPVVYPEESIKWLDDNLKALTEADPDKYVIVITHAMIYNTVYGSLLDDTDEKHPDYWSTKVLTEVLRKYPQAVVFGGHLHFPLNDPRSVWQGEFTSMGTASTRYMAIDNGNYDSMAGRTVMRDCNEYSEGLLLQFDKKGNMRAIRMDFYNHDTIGEPWTFDRPAGDGSHLKKYSHERRRTANRAPVMKHLSVSGGENKLKAVWTAAADDEFAHTYFLTVKKDGREVAKRKILADFYHEPRPEMMKKTWAREIPLEPGEYEVSVYAVDSWDAASNVLTQTCTVYDKLDKI